MTVRLRWPVVLVLAVLAACSAPVPTEVDAAALISCGAPATDVSTEPGWRQFGEYRLWKTADDCLVRIDVISDRQGPEHCGFEDARVIITAIPFGGRMVDDRNAAVYVRDPTNVFEDAGTAQALELDVTLPASAVDTGLRQDGDALWLDPADRSAIYLVTDAVVERWPLDPQPAGCT